MEKGVLHPRELAVLEVYSDLDNPEPKDPNEVQCMQSVVNAPHCNWSRVSMDCWHRLPQETVLQGMKSVPVSFGIAILNTEIKQLPALHSLLEETLLLWDY